MNTVTVTFEFQGLPDGHDDDLLSDAVERLKQCCDSLNEGDDLQTLIANNTMIDVKISR